MAPHRSRKKIEGFAAQLLEEFGIDTPPVDVEQLADKLGYRVVLKFFDQEDLSGTVMRDKDGSVTLGINTIHARVRQRFSIAHEIGHARLHLTKDREDLFVDPPARVLFRDHVASLGENPQEIEANQFAAGLLMPAPMIARTGSALLASAEGRLSIDDLVERLSRKFEVSSQAMRFRLVTLGVIEPA